MELRRSRKQNTKASLKLESSDDERDHVVKKAKLSNGTERFIKATTQLSSGPALAAKRTRRKNTLFSNYKMDSDTDSDYEIKSSRSGSRNRILGKRKRGKIQPGQNKLELLLNWKKDLVMSEIPKDKDSFKIVKTKNILTADLKHYAQDLQAILVNIKWKTKSETNGITIKEFDKLDLNRKLLRNGIVFIWSEKEVLWDIIKAMEDKGFNYIENLAVILLDESKLRAYTTTKKAFKQIQQQQQQKKPEKSKITNFFKSRNSPSTSASDKTESQESAEESKANNIFDLINQYPNVEADQIYREGESDYFKKAKKVLLMFRRNESKETTLELRHQRTCDAVFDIVHKSQKRLNSQIKEYIYRMIETLLPKANYHALTNKQLKMMELWGDVERPREGWISICEDK